MVYIEPWKETKTMFDSKILNSVQKAFARRSYEKCRGPRINFISLPHTFNTQNGPIYRKPDKPIWIKSTKTNVKLALVTCSDEKGINQSLTIKVYDWENGAIQMVAELSKIDGKHWEKKFRIPGTTTLNPVQFAITILTLVDVHNCINGIRADH